MTNQREQDETRAWVSETYNAHLRNGRVDQKEEAFECKVDPSTVSNWANKRREQYNLTIWALFFSKVGEKMLESIAFKMGKILLDVPTGTNGRTDDEREGVLSAMAKIQTCTDAKCEKKYWSIILKLAQRALKECDK